MRYRISVSFSKFAVAGRVTGSPHPRQVIRGAGQRPLPRDLLPSAFAEPPHPTPSVQPTRQIRVGNIGIDLPLLQSFPIDQREKSAVGTGSLQLRSALL